MGRCYAKQWNLAQFLIELTLIDYSMRDTCHHILACLAVIISNCFFSCPLPSNRQVRCLSQKCCGSGCLGQTETPPREAWGFVFPGCRSHLQSGLASGLKKLAPCRLIGVRGKTSDEGFMGARRSTETGSARWFLFPTKTWEPPLLTWVV